MEIDGESVVNRISQQGFSQLGDMERDWVTEMTKTRHPYWDPLIQEAYLRRTSSNDVWQSQDLNLTVQRYR